MNNTLKIAILSALSMFTVEDDTVWTTSGAPAVDKVNEYAPTEDNITRDMINQAAPNFSRNNFILPDFPEADGTVGDLDGSETVTPDAPSEGLLLNEPVGGLDNVVITEASFVNAEFKPVELDQVLIADPTNLNMEQVGDLIKHGNAHTKELKGLISLLTGQLESLNDVMSKAYVRKETLTPKVSYQQMLQASMKVHDKQMADQVARDKLAAGLGMGHELNEQQREALRQNDIQRAINEMNAKA